MLKVPPGHKRAGQPMELPSFAVAWLRESLRPGVREAGLFVGRKNAKSAILAAYLLARLVAGRCARLATGPASPALTRSRRPNSRRKWRTSRGHRTWSVLRFLRSPAPGPCGESYRVGGHTERGQERGPCHPAFDDALIDELGLLSERERALVNGLRTSTSARRMAGF